jgi:hypothetical protein
MSGAAESCVAPVVALAVLSADCVGAALGCRGIGRCLIPFRSGGQIRSNVRRWILLEAERYGEPRESNTMSSLRVPCACVDTTAPGHTYALLDWLYPLLTGGGLTILVLVPSAAFLRARSIRKRFGADSSRRIFRRMASNVQSRSELPI